MQKNQKRLGRGLSSLISFAEGPDMEAAQAAAETGRASVMMVNAGHIRPNPFQPRKQTAPNQLEALAQSIRKTGVLQPVILRQRGEELYEIVAGDRRWRAAQMAGLGEIPAVIRDASEQEMLEIALVENIFREDLNPIDRAGAYRRYCDEFNLSAEEVANRLGEDRTTVTNYLRLLELPIEVKEWVAGGRLSMGHARCLLGLRSATELIRTAKEAMAKELSVRAVERLVRERIDARSAGSKLAAGGRESKRPQIRSLEQAFMQALGTKVEIHESRRTGRGRIVIHYFTLDDFDRIGERLGLAPQ